jgi:hypothetical protein
VLLAVIVTVEPDTVAVTGDALTFNAFFKFRATQEFEQLCEYEVFVLQPFTTMVTVPAS